MKVCFGYNARNRLLPVEKVTQNRAFIHRFDSICVPKRNGVELWCRISHYGKFGGPTAIAGTFNRGWLTGEDGEEVAEIILLIGLIDVCGCGCARGWDWYGND